jgi:hypothetical protein
MNIDDLTYGQLKAIAAIFGSSTSKADEPKTTESTAFEIGKSYFIRTATYAATGRLVAIHPNELVLEDAAWIADTGRFHNALKDGKFSEVEPFCKPLIVFRGGGIDATEWPHPLPREQK